MKSHADVLRYEDARIPQMFNVAEETRHSGHALIEDPFPGLKRLLQQGGVQKGGVGDLLGLAGDAGQWALPDRPTYSALSFAAVSKALIENETYSSHAYYDFHIPTSMGETILNKVGDEHRRYRGPIQPLFSPDAAQTWWNEKVILETVDVLIAGIEQKASADLFVELCARMPVHVVSTGFGLEPEEIIPFRLALIGRDETGELSVDQSDGRRKTHEILTRVIEARRREPANDIISRLVEAEVAQDDGSTKPFTNDEIISHCRLILVAGGGTTWRQLGITLFALLDNPDQFEDLKADRSLIGRVVLESARWHATDLVFPRKAAKDTVLEGVEIPEGSILHLCLGSANRDPQRWEQPDKFDLHRPIQRGVAFGGGPHSCLGQHVSRQEMEVALNAIMDRLPNVRWNPDQPHPRLVGGLFARGPSAIPVVFG